MTVRRTRTRAVPCPVPKQTRDPLDMGHFSSSSLRPYLTLLSAPAMLDSLQFPKLGFCRCCSIGLGCPLRLPGQLVCQDLSAGHLDPLKPLTPHNILHKAPCSCNIAFMLQLMMVSLPRRLSSIRVKCHHCLSASIQGLHLTLWT